MDEQRNDSELLREFALRGDQSAFAAVVGRHVDLVFGAAVRKLGDAGAAEELAQDVFAALARNAWRFSAGGSVAAWLYRTTLLKAKAWWRGEYRRRRREQTAAEMGTTMNIPEDHPAVHALVPLLDEGLLSLREKDRAALLLRFYERQPFRNVGASLGVSEDAAQKRVSSALDNLARFFQRRGLKTATAAASAAALQHTAVSAPAAFASAMAQSAMAASPPVLASWAAHLAGLGKLQAASLCLAIVAAPATWQWHSLQSARNDVAQAKARFDATHLSLATAQADSDRLQTESARLGTAINALTETQSRNAQALRKLDELKGRLRGLLAAADARWPEDLPFVRVPRSAVENLNAGTDAIDPSGKLSEVAAQLLNLTPAEQAFTESHLSEYFQKVSALASRRAYETNSDWRQDGWVSKTIAVPALGRDREQLWWELIEPVHKMLDYPRRNQFDICWMQSLWCGAFYPWVYDDQASKKPSTALFMLAIKPDGTTNPSYHLFHMGSVMQDGKLPIRGTLPGFLRDRFEPWLEGQGIYNIDTGQP